MIGFDRLVAIPTGSKSVTLILVVGRFLPRLVGWILNRTSAMVSETPYRTISSTCKVSDGEDEEEPRGIRSQQPHPHLFNSSVPNGGDSSTSRRINIRMIDRPDFHLAISGKTWAVIKEHYPWLIPKLVVKGTVFARFSPDQKTQLIEALQSVGYFVAMCGDGANDCGALKAAHAGVSLSEAEASVASPFTSKQQNISCIPTLIREGRCALVTTSGTLKFITSYSLIQFISVIALFYIGSSLSDGQFLYIDLFLITTLSVTFGYTKPYSYLSIEPPRVRLLSAVTLLSLGCHMLAHLVVQVLAFISVRAQPWYIPLFEYSEDAELCNYESTALFTVATYQYLISVIVFSKGVPYRRSLLSNYFLVINLLVAIVCTVCVTASTFNIRHNFLLLVDIPSLRYLILLHLMVLANFLLCYLMESVVEGVSFRRQLVHIRRVLFPRHIQRKDYERIRDEIDRLAGLWPPLIRSASVQALPRELFQDTDMIPPVVKPPGHPRRRNMSSMSTETEDEELSLTDHLTDALVSHIPAVESVDTPPGVVSPTATRTPFERNMNNESVIHRSHSFDAGKFNSVKDRVQTTVEGDSCGFVSPGGPSNLLDIPKTMFHVQAGTSFSIQRPASQGRKRHQNSEPQNVPFSVDNQNRSPIEN
ncbi:unnamed protein product [Echinostoma caproni]|uniref:Cation-transporting ATPase 13A3 n=1 Tax=Echinostoma caproni TaxID=27848 RepID=A0A183AH55_9TREM|nr:unnamed protein product [Echinostoma caproni]